MIPFFSTSASHYHTDICPNDCSNAHTHTLAQTWALTHTPPTTLPLSTVHVGRFTLFKPPCRTNGLSLATDPFCLCQALHVCSQFGLAWWMQMGTYLIGSVPKMEIKGGDFFFFFCLPSFPKLFWDMLSSAVCGDNVNEKGQGVAAAARLIQKSLLLTSPHFNMMRGGKLRWPHCVTASQC